MLFGLDLDFDMDFDIDADFNMDMDMDTDIDTDAGVDPGGVDLEGVFNAEIKEEDKDSYKRKPLKWWQSILIFFNFSGLPFLFTFTAWVFFWWLITLYGTHITESYDNSFGVIIFLAAMIPALFINKLFTAPFKSIFKKLERDGVDYLNLIGETGTLISDISGNELGSAKLVIEYDPINIYVKSIKGEPIASGSEILVIEQSEDKKYYYIQAYN